MEQPALYDELNVEGFCRWGTDVSTFADVIDIARPKRILEIGFFRGASSFFWLYLSKAKVLSIDSMRWEGCELNNVKKLMDKFPERFNFICESSDTVHDKLKCLSFDLIYIDGGHDAGIVQNDVQLAIDLKVPYILLDDAHSFVLRIFKSKTGEFYEIIKEYRRADNIPLVLAKRKEIPEDQELESRIKELEDSFNYPKVDIVELPLISEKSLWDKIINFFG